VPYIDTCVLMAFYCPEPLSDVADEALSATTDPVISPMVELELVAAMASKVRTRELTRSDADAAMGQFRTQIDDGYFRVVTIGPREIDLAKDWLSRFTSPLRTLDALHMAAAFANNEILLTADKGLAKSAAEFGVPCTLLTL